MLEVRERGRGPAERRRVERAAPRCERKDGRDTRHRLETARREVLVWHQVAEGVEKRPEGERREPGSGCGARGRPCRDVEGDDHGVAPQRRGTPSGSASVPPRVAVNAGLPSAPVALQPSAGAAPSAG